MPNDTDLAHQGAHQDCPTTKDLESADRLIALLDFEIEQIDREETQPGWNTWALYVGLATLFAFLLADLENGPLHLRAVGIVLLVLFITYDCLVIFRNLIDEPTPSHPTHRFRLAQQIIGPRRSAVVIDFVRFTALIVLAFHLQPFLAAPYTAFLCFFLGGLALIMLVGIARSVLWFPVLTGQPLPGLTKILFLVLLLSGASALLGVAQSLRAVSITVTIADIRIAAILFAAALLIRVLVQSQPTNPLRPSLLTIRRRLALQELFLDAARQQIDIALQGMTVSDLLQRHIAEMLSDWDEINRGNRSLAAKLDEISTILDMDYSPVTADIVQTRLDEVPSLLNNADQISESLSALMDRLYKRLQKLHRRALLLARVSPPSERQIIQMLRTIDPAFAAYEATSTIVRDRLDQLVRQTDSLELKGGSR